MRIIKPSGEALQSWFKCLVDASMLEGSCFESSLKNKFLSIAGGFLPKAFHCFEANYSGLLVPGKKLNLLFVMCTTTMLTLW